MRKTGIYEYIGTEKCFLPDPLPPRDPALIIDAETSLLYGEAMNRLGQLNGMIGAVPDTRRFINTYVIKEAILSSEIEGIHTTILEVFTQPLVSSKPRKETQLVLNYKQALDHALSVIVNNDFPITTRVISEAHRILMEHGAGEKSNPGNFRKQHVRVGNLIPAPPLEIPKLMGQLEEFINTNETIPPLIKAGLAHVQFETIHPFLDGNGRIGRLLIVLSLIKSNVLSEPLLYPSYYFKKYSLEYYRSLDRVRTAGDFEGWIKFYLLVIKESCTDAYLRAKDIESLHKKLADIIRRQELSDKMENLRLHALALLFSSPTITASDLEKKLDNSYNTARQIIDEFCKLSILVESEKKQRGQVFYFQNYLEILEKEYDL